MGVRIKVKDATIRMISRGCLVDKPARSSFCGVDKLSLREGPYRDLGRLLVWSWVSV
jgi:hypothetical protein